MVKNYQELQFYNWNIKWINHDLISSWLSDTVPSTDKSLVPKLYVF